MSSIYFGGGTPSLLSKEQIERILHCISENYTLADDVEVTLEGNPESIVEKLKVESWEVEKLKVESSLQGEALPLPLPLPPRGEPEGGSEGGSEGGLWDWEGGW